MISCLCGTMSHCFKVFVRAVMLKYFESENNAIPDPNCDLITTKENA